jgi:dynein assembly factor with WDR repeat domains 1
MDNTCKLWDVETGAALHTLIAHTAEIVSLHFNQSGSTIITGSFDNTVRAWDTRTGRCIRTLSGHTGEISATQFNFGGDQVVSGEQSHFQPLLERVRYRMMTSMLQGVLTAQ